MIEMIAAVWSALPRREARRRAQPKGHTRRQASRNAVGVFLQAGFGQAAALRQAQSYHTRHQGVYGPCPFSRQTAKAVHELGHADAARLQQEQESLRDHPQRSRTKDDTTSWRRCCSSTQTAHDGIDLILESPSTKGEQWNPVRDGSDSSRGRNAMCPTATRTRRDKGVSEQRPSKGDAIMSICYVM